MLATAIIVFREVLEAALIVGIVLAASQGVPSRGFWVGGGIAGGILGAVVVAGFAETLAAAMAAIGQEIFNAAILFAAVAMLGWHNIWMRRHAGELAAAANRLGAAVRAGSQPLWGGYGPFNYLNWAAKFYMDALLLHLFKVDVQNSLKKAEVVAK